MYHYLTYYNPFFELADVYLCGDLSDAELKYFDLVDRATQYNGKPSTSADLAYQ